MAVLEYKLPLQANILDGASSGAATWFDPENIKIASDLSMARPDFFWGSTETLKLLRAHLIIDGAIDEANNKAGPNTVTSLATVTLGGSSDMWGATLTPAQIRSDSFGVALAYGETDTGVTTVRTRYLSAQEFAFDLPDSAVVTGVEMQVEHVRESTGGGTTQTRVDSIKLRVHYTYAPKIQAHGYGGGFVYVAGIESSTMQKHFRHRVDQGGVFVGEWMDDAIDPSFKEELNNPTSDMMIQLARNELTRFPVVEDELLEDDDPALTEDDEALLLDLAAATGIGEGTDMDLNYDYRLTAYYGRYTEELLENGEVLMTEDDEVMLLEDGFPAGRDLFTGYLSYHESDWGESEDLKVHILSHSHELNNIKLETEDTAYIDNYAIGAGDTIGVGSIEGKGDPYLVSELWQTFTMAAQKKVSRISFKGYLQREQNISIEIRSGTTAGAGTVLASGVLNVTAAMVDDYEETEFSIALAAAVTLPAASYIMKITSDGWARTNNFGNYPVFFLENVGVYAGGNLTKRAWNGAGTVQSYTSQSPYDLRFKLWEPGGSTSVPMLSMDPTTMFRKVLDFAATRGARVRYDPALMPPTGTVVSYTFNNMTVRKALDKILELMPADWFYRYDFGNNTMEIGPRPTAVDYTATLGADIVKLKLRRSIEDLINDVFYTGGGDPSLFVRVTDPTSIAQWRRGLADLSDNRVTVEATARLLAQVFIDAKKDPLWSGSITLGNDTPIFLEDIRPGMLFGFSGLGPLHDAVKVQLMSRSYNVDTIDGALNTLPPKVLKRIEDIKRNLDAIEQANAASSPS